MALVRVERETVRVHIMVDGSEESTEFDIDVSRDELIFLDKLQDLCKQHHVPYGGKFSFMVVDSHGS